jgi:hypothetical protein
MVPKFKIKVLYAVEIGPTKAMKRAGKSSSNQAKILTILIYQLLSSLD